MRQCGRASPDFPIVSSVQSVADFLNQLDPPPGFGHDYSTDYVTGWASIVPPAVIRQKAVVTSPPTQKKGIET